MKKDLIKEFRCCFDNRLLMRLHPQSIVEIKCDKCSHSRNGKRKGLHYYVQGTSFYSDNSGTLVNYSDKYKIRQFAGI